MNDKFTKVFFYFSFFAGYITKDEADQVIGNAEKVGTFLIRFSSTFAHTGSFVVCLKTETGPEHILLQVIFRTTSLYISHLYVDIIYKQERAGGHSPLLS